MKQVTIATVFVLISLGTLLSGCARDPGVVPDVPMTEQELKENERVGQVPGS